MTNPQELDPSEAEALQRALRALFGIATLARDALAESFDHMVQRGEQVQVGMEDNLHAVMGQFRLQGQAFDPELPFGGNMDWIAERLGLASRHDIRILQHQLDQLADAVEALRNGKTE